MSGKVLLKAASSSVKQVVAVNRGAASSTSVKELADSVRDNVSLSATPIVTVFEQACNDVTLRKAASPYADELLEKSVEQTFSNGMKDNPNNNNISTILEQELDFTATSDEESEPRIYEEEEEEEEEEEPHIEEITKASTEEKQTVEASPAVPSHPQFTEDQGNSGALPPRIYRSGSRGRRVGSRRPLLKDSIWKFVKNIWCKFFPSHDREQGESQTQEEPTEENHNTNIGTVPRSSPFTLLRQLDGTSLVISGVVLMLACASLRQFPARLGLSAKQVNTFTSSVMTCFVNSVAVWKKGK